MEIRVVRRRSARVDLDRRQRRTPLVDTDGDFVVARRQQQQQASFVTTTLRLHQQGSISSLDATPPPELIRDVGLRLWRASLFLGDFLLHAVPRGDFFVGDGEYDRSPRLVLELGCGVGLLLIVMERALMERGSAWSTTTATGRQKTHYMATDYRVDIIELARCNVTANACTASTTATPATTMTTSFHVYDVFSAAPYPFELPHHIVDNAHITPWPSVILCADLFYDDPLTEAVITQLRYLLGRACACAPEDAPPDATAYIAFERRVNHHAVALRMPDAKTLQRVFPSYRHTRWRKDDDDAYDCIVTRDDETPEFIYAAAEIYALRALCEPFQGNNGVRMEFRIVDVTSAVYADGGSSSEHSVSDRLTLEYDGCCERENTEGVCRLWRVHAVRQGTT